MMKLTMGKGPCSVRNVNNRTERHGDEDRVLGQDVDLSFETTIDFLDALALDDGHRCNWQAFLFQEDGSPFPLGIKPLAFTRKYEDHEAEFWCVKAGVERTRKISEVKVHKIVAEPIFKNQLRVSMQLQMTPQAQDTVGYLAMLMVNDSVKFKLSCKQADAFSDAGAATGNKATAPGKRKGKGKAAKKDDTSEDNSSNESQETFADMLEDQEDSNRMTIGAAH